jgi:hypothetical protein
MRLALLLLISAAAQASTTIDLPNATVYVNLASGNTVVGINGLYYRGASEFVYFSECSKPDVPYRYRCNIMVETDVVLRDAAGNPITVSITAQFASIYVASGHPYWRQSQTVLSGEVVAP